MKRLARSAAVVPLALVAVGLPADDRAVATVDERPNVLIIVTDDQRADLMSVMPRTLERFAQQGVTYANGFANTPLCCPARASIFSGRFAHNHGVVTNAGPEGFDHGSTLQHHLQSAGFRTGIVGKFFNGWDVRKDPPFFDRWAITSSQKYDGATYNVDGSPVSVSQYSTDYIADMAEGFVRGQESEDATPWFLHVAPIAPHLPVSVAPEYEDASVDPWVPAPSVTKAPDPDVVDGTRRMLMSVDDLVEQVFGVLDELGEAENTLAFFTSDNGFMWNEHGLWAKTKPHTESIRVPFFVRWPGHFPAGAVNDQPVAHVDIAPTILDAAGVAAPPMDGSSMLQPAARTDMLTEAWRGDGTLAWASLRTETYQYIEWFRSDGLTLASRAFFRLDQDPWQMADLVGDPMEAPDVSALHTRLVEAMGCSGGAECTALLTSTSVEVHDTTAPEGAGQIAFDVTLSHPGALDVEVPYAVRDGTATYPADHEGGTGTVTIPAGQTSGRIVISLVQDSVDEFDETLLVDLSSAVNGTVIRRTAIGTITDDDPPPTTIVSDASAGEAEATMSFPVNISAPSGKAITARYSTVAGTATPGEDYIDTEGTLQIPAGQTSATIPVTVLDDSLDEPDETFTVTLSDPEGATIADGEAVGTILDDDDPPPSPPPPVEIHLAVSDAAAGESEPAMTFTVTLSEASSSKIAVAYNTSNGTATAGKDYRKAASTLRIPAGQTSATIPVTVLDDSVDEPDETFTVTLSDPKGASIADGEAVGTILDDDDPPPPPPAVHLAISDSAAGESEPAIAFTVTLSEASSSKIAVSYATSDLTAVAGKDYKRASGTFTIPAGQTSATITVSLIADSVDEVDETFLVTLSDPKGATIADGDAIGTILDDDEPSP